MKLILWGILTLTAYSQAFAESTSKTEIEALRQALHELKSDYETRISELESRLSLTEERVSAAKAENYVVGVQAQEALSLAEDAAFAAAPSIQNANTFNPKIGLTLVGTLASLTHDSDFSLPGFSLAPETGPKEEGIALGESELNFNANVDDKFFANLTFALASEDGGTEVELEEAYIQSLAVPGGVTITAGRFFSGLGYVNSFHTHVDDFVERSLPYQVFLGGQYKDLSLIHI